MKNRHGNKKQNFTTSDLQEDYLRFDTDYDHDPADYYKNGHVKSHSNEQESSFGQSMDKGSADYEPQWMGQQYPKSMKTIADDNSGNFIRNHRGKGPKGYKRSDERIKEDVCEILTRHPQIDASEIEVEVDHGCVYLKGIVESRHVKKIAEHSIEFLPGVNDVQNQLRLKNTSAFLNQNDNLQNLS